MIALGWTLDGHPVAIWDTIYNGCGGYIHTEEGSYDIKVAIQHDPIAFSADKFFDGRRVYGEYDGMIFEIFPKDRQYGSAGQVEEAVDIDEDELIHLLGS